jgi:CDP-glycerol glycerophosphotransferase (TagB/SpsB family)
VICGSEKMGNIFKESFNLSNERILKIGIPKTDFYFDDTKKEKIIKKMTEKYPVINNKKLILYAPTFRDHQLQSTSMILDIDKMYKEFSDKFVLFIRMHPSVKYELENHYQDFLYDVSTEKEISDLLLITDLLITDYSSIPMEFSLLKKPMIFFAYDLEDYAKTRGLWEDYDKLVPGPVVKNMEKLIENIKNETYDYKKIEEFAKDWNEYSNGCSSKNVVDTLYSNKKGSV